MKISVITVCKNAEDTIEKSIATVVNQSYENIEHIIIDGGSEDKTLEIIDKYRDNITYFLSEPDHSIYDAMNKGIKASAGEIVYFLNTNDYLYDEDVIKDVVELFRKTKAGIVFGNISFLDENGNQKELRSYAEVDKLFLTSEGICHQCIFYKREVLQKCGNYDENFRIIADYDLNLKAIMRYEVKTRHFDRTIAHFTLGGISNNEKYHQQLEKEKELLLNKYFKPYHFSANKILNKTFRNIARNPELRRITGRIFGFALP